MQTLRAMAAVGALIATTASAQSIDLPSQVVVQTGGLSAIWALANFCYAGMRAQGSLNTGWRIIAFISGFPGTLISYFVVRESSERVFGVDLPKRPDR